MQKIKLFIYRVYGHFMRTILSIFDSSFQEEIGNKLEPVKPIIYTFWTGNNELTENRKKCLQTLIKTTGVEVKLISAFDLHEYEDQNFPFHSAYQYLSYNHRSDYLRCYFMHVYGGAYSDIKENISEWKSSFDRLNQSNDWILGYPEIAPSGVPHINDEVLRKRLQRNYFRLIGNGCFICKPRTPLTQEWFDSVHHLMDMNHDKLKCNPGNMWGNNPGYPLRWAEVQGELFHPLIFKYHDKVLYDERMRLSFVNYK